MVGLRLDFVPAQPSHLRHAFTPRSPASPLESTAKRVCYTKRTLDSDTSSDSTFPTISQTSNPPSSPYKWMWYCHQCRTGYELGVTRRCLVDDHQLCYGQPIKKRFKKGDKKNRSCQSEFDYTGWQNYGAWKRSQNGQDSQDGVQTERNCAAFCDWPSQCRWTRKHKQPLPESCEKPVEQVTPDTSEESVMTTNEVTNLTQKSTDSTTSIIRSAAKRLSSQWTSLLTPIEEEPASDSIEGFLSLARANTNPTTVSERAHVSCQDYQMSDSDPFVEPLQTVQDIGNSALSVSTTDAKSNAFGFDFDFGFNSKMENEETTSITEGLHELVAGTVGIALSVPSSVCLERQEYGRRCVSAPPTRGTKLQAQLLDERRMSAKSI
ncbi:MAG: hypothetical protein L6R41_006797 [Letrouitia leprolyta]|nr:MAG: hypothetical protein L6R41_006797 [Letrouitia leprolyta]